MMWTFGLRLVALLIAFSAAGLARANDETYPAKPIRLIVPSGPGAGMDIPARIVAEALGSHLGQKIYIENKPGASMRMGTIAAARSASDGYTILWAPTTPVTIAEHLAPKFEITPSRDLMPIAIVVRQPVFLVVRKSFPAQSFEEFVRYARTASSKVTFGIQGIGGEFHLILEMIKKRTGADIVTIPYNVAAQAITDLLADSRERLDGMLLVSAAIRQSVSDGRLRILATLSPARLIDFSDVPTIAELGYPDLSFEPWFGLLAPAGLQPPVLQKWIYALDRIKNDAGVQRRLAAVGAKMEIVKTSAFSAVIDRERRDFGVTVKDLGLDNTPK